MYKNVTGGRKYGKAEPSNEQSKEEHQFSQAQYDMLLRCSDKKDMTEWNRWKEINPI